MARPKVKKTPKTLFSKRIYYLFGDTNYSEFEKKYGLSVGQISKFISGVEPRQSALEAIVNGTGCDASWLLTGVGEPFKDGSMKDGWPATTTSDFPESNAIKPPDGIDTMSVGGSMKVVGSAAADESKGAKAGLFLADAAEVWDDVVIPEYAHMVKVIGDSMAPVLLGDQYAIIGAEYALPDGPRDRDIVVVEVVVYDDEQSGTDAHWEGVYCKRVMDAGDSWLFTSINQTGTPFTVAKTNCRIWPVIGVWFAGRGKTPDED